MLALSDGFLADMLGQFCVAPVFHISACRKILVMGRKLALQHFFKNRNDFATLPRMASQVGKFGAPETIAATRLRTGESSGERIVLEKGNRNASGSRCVAPRARLQSAGSAGLAGLRCGPPMIQEYKASSRRSQQPSCRILAQVVLSRPARSSRHGGRFSFFSCPG